MEGLQMLHHARRLELEDALGVAAAVDVLVGVLVVDRNGLDVDPGAEALLDHVKAGVDDGQGVETEEVHLQHSDVFNVMAVILGSPDILACFLVHRQADRDVVGQVAAADDGGAGMHSHLTDASLQLPGEMEDVPDLRCAVIEFVDELRHKPVAVFQGNLHIDILESLLEPLGDGLF